jgi:hypothetical protein
VRQGWGRLIRNPRLAAAGRTEIALARIAGAHARVNREVKRDLHHWLEQRTQCFPRPADGYPLRTRPPQLRLVR